MKLEADGGEDSSELEVDISESERLRLRTMAIGNSGTGGLIKVFIFGVESNVVRLKSIGRTMGTAGEDNWDSGEGG
jgi:hypothetical protein